MENRSYSERYKNEPCQIAIPGAPVLAKSESFSDGSQVRIAGIRTLKISVKQALHLTEAMLKPVRQQLKKGHHQDLVKLLDNRPEFSAHPWVREELVKWIRTGRTFRKRGRKMGSFKRHPLVIAAVVDELINRQCVSSKDAAFAWLDEHEWLGYETAKKQYYQAIGEDRFRAVLIQGSIWSTPKPRLKAQRLIRGADQLYAGQSITRKLYESRAGTVTVTLTAF